MDAIVQWCTYLRNYLVVPQKYRVTKTYLGLPYNQELFLSVHTQRIENLIIHKNLHKIFIATLSMIAKCGSNLNVHQLVNG